MAIHHKALEQHYTSLMAHSGLPYDINPPPHSTDFICKVVGRDKLFFLFCVCACVCARAKRRRCRPLSSCRMHAPLLTLVCYRYAHAQRNTRTHNGKGNSSPATGSLLVTAVRHVLDLRPPQQQHRHRLTGKTTITTKQIKSL